MAQKELLAAVAALLDDLAARPEDRVLLQEQLRRKIAEMRAEGLPVRAELLQFEDDPSQEPDDDFDNMPI